jgi:DNA polymerase III sliding clamp (beta) subunit (PCNA family)
MVILLIYFKGGFMTSWMDTIKKCLDFSISDDETRLSITGVFYDPETCQAVSTNGHVLTATKLYYCAELANMIIGDNRFIPLEFPRWQMIVPTKKLNSVKVNIYKDLIRKGKLPKDRVLYFDGTCFHIEKIEGYKFAVDSSLLKPLIGCENITLCYSDNNLGPIKFQLSTGDDNVYIVIPLNADKF